MQQMYQCPRCGSPVAFGAGFCTNCGTGLNWPTQQTQQPPLSYQQTQYTYQGYEQQAPERKKANPLLIASIALIATVVLVGGTILAIQGFRQSTSPTMPPTTPTQPSGSGTPAADNTPPTISNVVSSPTETSAVITWLTNEPANSQVEYGITNAYGSASTLVQALVTSHSITISGLNPSTIYHFRAKSRDGSGNEALSGDYTFTTSKPTPKAEVQILEHRLVVEHPSPTLTFTLVKGKVKNSGQVTVAAIDVNIWVQYEVEGLEGQTFNMPGSMDLEPAAFQPGEVRDFDVLLQNGAKEGYDISLSVVPR